MKTNQPNKINYKHEVARLSTMLENVLQQLSQLRVRYAKKQSQISEKNMQLQLLQNQLKKYCDKYQKRQKYLQKLQLKIEYNQKQNASQSKKKQELNSIKTKNLLQQVKRLEKENQQLHQQIEQKTQNSIFQQQLEIIKQKMKLLQLQKVQLLQQIKQKNSIIERLKIDLYEIQKNNQILEINNRQKSMELKKLEDKYIEASKNQNNWKNKILSLDLQYQNQAKQFQKFQNIIKALSQQKDLLTKDVLDLKIINQQLQNNVQQLNYMLRQIQSKKQFDLISTQNNKKQLDELNSKLQILIQQNDQLKDIKLSNQARIQNYERQLQSLMKNQYSTIQKNKLKSSSSCTKLSNLNYLEQKLNKSQQQNLKLKHELTKQYQRETFSIDRAQSIMEQNQYLKNHMSKINEQWEKYVFDLKKKVQYLEQENQFARIQIENLRYNSLEEQKINNLEHQNNQKNKQLNNQLLNQIRSLQQQIFFNKNKIQQLMKEKKYSDQKQIMQEKDQQQIRNQLQRQKLKYKQQKKQHNHSINTLKSQIASLITNNQCKQRQLYDLKNIINNDSYIKQENFKLKMDLQRYGKDIMELKSKILSLIHQNNRLNQNMGKYQQIIQENYQLKQILSKKQQELSKYNISNEQYKQLKNQKMELQFKNENLIKKNKDLIQQNRKHIINIQIRDKQINYQKNNLTQYRNRMLEEKEGIKLQLQNALKINYAQKQECQNLRYQNERINNHYYLQNQNKKNQIKIFKEKLNQAQQNLIKHNFHYNNLKIQIERKQKQIGELKEHIRINKQIYQNNNFDVKTKQNIIMKLNEDIQDIKKTIHIAKQQNITLRNQNSLLLFKIENLTNEQIKMKQELQFGQLQKQNYREQLEYQRKRNFHLEQLYSKYRALKIYQDQKNYES